MKEQFTDSIPTLERKTHLPPAREVLAAAGVEYHFIVGGDEPAVTALDTQAIVELADAAEAKLLKEKTEQS